VVENHKPLHNFDRHLLVQVVRLVVLELESLLHSFDCFAVGFYDSMKKQ
jgi:hypothetical protein